jgi:hypothetical protein
MVWKIVTISNPGSATQYGADDITKINRYLSGVDLTLETASDKVDIGTPTTFNTDALKIKAPTSGFSYIVRGQDIAADRIISLPLMTGPGELALAGVGTVNDWGTNMQTFRHQNIQFRNPLNTFSYILNTGAITADRNISLPVLTADDTIVFVDAEQTLENKTLINATIPSLIVDVDSSTIKHSTTNNSGDLLVNNGTKYDRLARGTANQVPIMNPTGTGIIWIDSASLGSGGGGGGAAATGDFSVPGVGNTITGAWYATNTTAGAGVWSDFLTSMSDMSPTRPNSLNMYLKYTCTDSGDDAGFRTSNVHFSRANNPELWVRYAVVSTAPNDTDYRIAIGFSNDLDEDFGTNNALDGKSGFMWYKEELDSSIGVGRNDGDVITDKDSSLVSLTATNNNINTIRIFGDDTNSRFGISLNGGTAQYYTTEIPAQTTNLGCVVYFENGDSNNRDFNLYGAYFRATVI